MLLNKTIVSLVLVCFLALPGAYAQTLSPVDSLAVFDATGTRLGVLYPGDGTEGLVFFQAEGLFFSVNPLLSRISGNRTAISFESSDCSGQSWFSVRSDERDIVAPSLVFVGTGTALIGDSGLPLQPRDQGSQLSEDGICSVFDRPEIFGLSVRQFPGLFAQFTPPFSVQVDQAGIPAASPKFPALIRGDGSSTRVVVGAGDTALSVDASFHAPDGSLLETQSVEVPPNGASSIDFEGGDLEFGSLALAVEPPDAHVLSTEVVSLVGTPSLGVIPSPLCTNPEFLMVESSDSHTAGAFSNPSSEDTASCDWEVFAGDGVSVGGGNFEVPPLGQVQFFPDEQIILPDEFLGSFKAACDAAVHIFSLFQKSDFSLTSNAAGCGEQ